MVASLIRTMITKTTFTLSISFSGLDLTLNQTWTNDEVSGYMI